MVITYTPCVLCHEEDPKIYVYAQHTGYPIGKKCWKMAEKLGQLNLTSLDKEIEKLSK